MIISLTGFMGCGKSSVGRKLSELLFCPFMDLDSAIEEEVGCSIPEIFASDGEAEFRRLEAEVLNMVIGHLPPSDKEISVVLALGGGTVMTKECAEMVHEKTLCVYLQASVDTLAEHLAGEADGRPMLKGDIRTRIEELMSLRAATYKKTAHVIIDTDGKSISEIAKEIRNNL